MRSQGATHCSCACAAAAPLQLTGRYNYTLAGPLKRALGSSPYLSGQHVARVLAFAPSVVMQLARIRSVAEFNRVVTGLIQVCPLPCWACVGFPAISTWLPVYRWHC
jgi:cobalamin biosynthesis protein CobD/CbiB